MIDSSTMIILSALFGAVLGNVGVWLYWLNVERKDKKRFEVEMASVRKGYYMQTVTDVNPSFTQEELDAHYEGKIRYGVGVKAVTKRVAFEAGAKWGSEQGQLNFSKGN